MTLPDIQKIRTQRNAADYRIGPLEPGYGVTIAHALQRVLMSSLPSAAVIALKVEQISGVEEEASDIVLNIKQLRIRCEAQHLVTIQLNVHGKRKVTAEDITVPTTVEIVNPDLHIATLSNDQAHLELDLVIQKGRGYIPADVHIERPPDMIPIDAIYTPVRRATYTIEHTRVGKMVNFDEVLLTIETDGTLHPDEALRQSAVILREQFLAFTTSPAPEQRRSSTSSDVVIPEKVYNRPLAALNLPIRNYNSFKRYSITTLGQILTLSEEEFLNIRNIGERSVPAIVESLRAAACFPPFLEDALPPE